MTHPAQAEKDVVQVVREVIAEALARDVSEVQLEHNLMEDLGAESLDFLDIVFKLERAFGIQITRGEMERAARGDMTDEEFAPAGVISEAGLARLRELMPEAADRIKPGLRPVQILALFSVRTFVNLAEAKRQGRTA
ncbi:acyl carrier protein [Archangium lipolyticum]|uniref:acyl carrier protein n=1 Tax=Archangium lipolyticum TaxID=2970465 RepID=UPI00214A4A85|nr:phosphopantetheine-binding protein [Archangium lipolyticum]